MTCNPAILKRKVYHFVWYADSMRKAEIAFEYNPETSRFDFESCIYSGVTKGAYDFDDWQFLNALSQEILRIYQMERG